MSKKVIAIDVDLTVVDTLTPWLNWFYSKTLKRVENESRSYNLEHEMIDLIKDSGVPPFNPLAFWHQSNLYDNLPPLPGSVEAVNRMIEAGYTVVFVSSCVSAHTDSKIRFLQKHFHKDCKFIATFHKELVDYVLLIDDRLSHIKEGNIHRPGCYHYLFAGVRLDGTEEDRNGVKCSVVNGWDHVTKLLFRD